MSVVIKNNILQLTDYKNKRVEIKDKYIGDIIDDKKNTITNVLTRFIGIIHFDSPHTKSSNKKYFIYKKCSVFFGYFNNLWIHTNKYKESKNMYAILKINWDKSKKELYGSVEEYIGYVNNYSIEYKVLNLLLTCHWSKKIDRIICGKDKKKIDLTFDTVNNRNTITESIYSIDPNNCEDIDDALQYVKMNDCHQVKVHIADVSSFFPINSFIWDEMGNRVESIYLNTDQIYMYPKEFTINYLSLKDDNNLKRAFTCILNFDENLNIKDCSFERNIIKVTNLTYDQANILINKKQDKNLLMLDKIARKNYGFFTHNDKEYKDSHNLVETFMILANNKVAEFISKNNKNCLLRVQEKNYVKYLNIKNKYSNKLQLLQMNRAEYKYKSKYNRHNGLGLELYTHFTSPIRRYADVLVHQIIHSILKSNKDMQEISIKKIFNLNHYHSHYKKCLIYENELNLVNDIFDKSDNSYIDLECIILDFHNNKCRVMTLDEKYIFDINILNEKIEKSSDIKISNITDNSINIEYKVNIIKLSIFNKILIRICYIPYELKKIKGYIKDPDLSFNLQ